MHCKHESEDNLLTELIIRIKINNFKQNQNLKSEISTVTSESLDQQFSTHNMIKSSESASIVHYKL